jgi:DNA-binding MarR family transcriptional regulator
VSSEIHLSLAQLMSRLLDGQDTRPPAVVAAVSALIRAEHRHAAFLAQAMDLPAADMLALYHLANEPLSSKALGERLGLTSGSITVLVDRLVVRKLARRTNHETDRRIVLVELTHIGRARSFKLLQHFIGDVQALDALLTTEERIVVDRFLRRLTERVDEDTTRLQALK